MEEVDLRNLLSQHKTFLMGLSMIAIMLFHQWWMDDDPITKFFHVFGYLGVDIFMLLSGFGISYSLAKGSILQFYKRRAIRILPACLFVGALKLLFDAYRGIAHSFPESFQILSNTYLWFISAILCFYLISPILIRIVKTHCTIFVIFMVVLTIIGQINQIGYCTMLGVSRLAIYGIGMKIGLEENVIVNRKQMIPMLCLVPALFAYGLCQYFKVFNVDGIIPTPLFFIPCILPTIWIVCKLDGKYIQWISYLGTFTLELYLWHEYIFKYIHSVSNDERSIRLFVLGIAVSILLAFITKQIIGLAFGTLLYGNKH